MVGWSLLRNVSFISPTPFLCFNVSQQFLHKTQFNFDLKSLLQMVFVLNCNLIFVFFLEPSEPIINGQTITPGLTTISLTWSPPLHPNGLIEKYNVCWHLRDGPPVKCDKLATIPNNLHTIYNLNPGTKYDISVLAFTKFGGKGLPALEQAETDKSGK
jgi:hypothetical protein